MVALLTIGCVTVCTAYSVSSLIRIHKDASIKENLARFLPPELVEKMMEEPDLLLRKTEKGQPQLSLQTSEDLPGIAK